MLIVRSTLEKLIPKMAHARWDTWSNTWLKNSTTIPAVGAAFTIVGAVQGPVGGALLQGALLTGGLFGVNAAAVAFRNRGQKPWTLPHEPWKQACDKVEKQLEGVIDQPHLFRMHALGSLSEVLRHMARTQLFLQGMTIQEVDTYVEVWTKDYSSGNASAALLLPDVLDKVNATLQFDEQDVERWVQASYLQSIHQKIGASLPGTTDALASIANANPAAMGFVLAKYGASLDINDLWKTTPASGWFNKTHWPQHVELVLHLQGHLPAPEHTMTPPLSPLFCYRQAMEHESSKTMPNIDQTLFETVVPSF